MSIIYIFFSCFCLLSFGMRDPSLRQTLTEVQKGSALFDELVARDLLIKNHISSSTKRDAVAPNSTYTMELKYNSDDIYNSTGLICSQTTFDFDNGATVSAGVNLQTGSLMQKVDGFVAASKPDEVILYWYLQTADNTDMFPKAVNTTINFGNGTQYFDISSGMLFYFGFDPSGLGLPLQYNGTMMISSFSLSLQKKQKFYYCLLQCKSSSQSRFKCEY